MFRIRMPFQNGEMINLDFFLSRFNTLVDDWENFHSTISAQWEAYQETISGQYEDLSEQFTVLYNYVHDYFDNLDLQEEVDHKIEEMQLDGTLAAIIKPYVSTTFDTVADMIADDTLLVGSNVSTLGYYAVNDGGMALYHITDVIPSGHYETLNIGLYAELITAGCVNLRQLGCKGDGSVDCSSLLQFAIDNYRNIIVPNGVYLLNSQIVLKSNTSITGEAARNYTTTDGVIFKSTVVNDYAFITDDTTTISGIILKNFKILGNNTNNSGLKIGSSATVGAYDIIMEHIIMQEVVTAFDFVSAWSVNVSRCIATTVTTGFKFGDYVGGTNSVFNDCMVYQCTYGWYFGAEPWKSTVFNACGADGCDYGFYLMDGRNLSIINAHIERVNVSGIKFTDHFTSATIIGANISIANDAANPVATFEIEAVDGSLTFINIHHASNMHTGAPVFAIDNAVDLKTLMFINCTIYGTLGEDLTGATIIAGYVGKYGPIIDNNTISESKTYEVAYGVDISTANVITLQTTVALLTAGGSRVFSSNPGINVGNLPDGTVVKIVNNASAASTVMNIDGTAIHQYEYREFIVVSGHLQLISEI